MLGISILGRGIVRVTVWDRDKFDVLGNYKEVRDRSRMSDGDNSGI